MITHRFIPSSLVLFLATLAAMGAQAAPPTIVIPKTAVVEIIEFGELQCPFTQRAQATLAALRQEYGDKLVVRFMHKPLPFHVAAVPAARAAEAARRQGAFEKMIALVFENQAALSDVDLEATFVGYAERLGLNVKRFVKDLADPALHDIVTNDARIADAVGVTGTPNFFVNGQALRGAQPIERFRELIDAELAAAVGANKLGALWVTTRLQAANAELYGYVYGGKAAPEAAPAKPKLAADRTVYKVEVDPKVDAILGNPTAPATLVTFIGYQCPFSRKLEPTVDALRAKYGDQLRVVVKQNPLAFHSNGRAAAAAAICARAQGADAFATVHDAMMAAEPDQLTVDALIPSVGRLGLSVETFRACMFAPATEAALEADIALAGRVTARGTPSSFINGVKVVGAKPEEEFVAEIDEALAGAKKLIAAGVAREAVYAKTIEGGKVFEALETRVHTFSDQDVAILGDANAAVRVTLFADLECPFSQRVFPVLGEVVAHYQGRVAVAFRHFPLSFHQNAEAAAEAAACAHEQGRFWDYAKAVYYDMRSLPSMLDPAAAELGLDTKKFAACRKSDAKLAVIARDLAEGKRVEVKGTPTIYIQGRKWSSPSGYNLETFVEVIDKLLGIAPAP